MKEKSDQEFAKLINPRLLTHNLIQRAILSEFFFYKYV